MARSPSGISGNTWLNSDGRKRLSTNLSAGFRTDRAGGWNRSVGVTFNLKPSDRLTLSVGPDWSRNYSHAQYVQSVTDPDRDIHLRRPLRLWRHRSMAADHDHARERDLLAPRVAAGVHAAAAGNRRLQRLQGTGPAADLRLPPIWHRHRLVGVRSGGAHLHGRSRWRRRRRAVHVQRSRLQLQVAAPECGVPLGDETRLEFLRGVDAATAGLHRARPLRP